MKIFKMKTAFLLLLIFSFPCVNAQAKSDKDKADTSSTHDFGKIREGDKPKHKFQFVNNTENKLKILKIRVPCGCANTKVDKNELNPGEKAEFDIQLESKGRRGKIKKSLYLITDSKKLPMVKYTIIADIAPKPAPVCSAPSRVDAGKIKPKEKKKLSFVIENKGVLDLTVAQGIKTSTIATTTEFPITIKPGEKESVEIEVTAPFYEGKFRSNLMLKTNDKSKPDLWILVIGDVKK